jgi:hypothetical protein
VFVTRTAPLLTALVIALAFGQNERLHKVPDVYVRQTGEAVTIDTGSVSDTFIAGLGWLSGADAPAPVSSGGSLFVGAANLERFGLAPDQAPAAAVPRLVEELTAPAADLRANVRFGGDSEIRVVVDLPGLASAAELAGLERQGHLPDGSALVLDLPRVALPHGQPDPYHGIDVTLLQSRGETRFELRGPELTYRVFTLEQPTRLVVDVLPVRRREIVTASEQLREGVVYRTFGAPTPSGPSLVHLLEIAPGVGEFRVVGTSEVPRTLSELAGGAFVAINAGYFDTSTYRAIGLLRVDYGLLSLPSRNRASIGFGFSGPVMRRVTARVNFRAGGNVYRREAQGADDAVQVHASAGAQAGSVRMGALVSQHGRIIANRVGPVTVPANGFVVVYPPHDRELALIDPGAPASLEVDFEPEAFETVRYAVEAGPLLVQDGEPAFEPDREEFSRGQRILDAYTQQAAIGVRPDGTVLLLVADDMRAEDLVPLFLSLGASEAMRLDSGSSATLLADGKVLNRARQRRIVSAIVFLPEGS